eukprot:GHVU01025039.1.p2 GENE.GHVU01025039.1~~GHVU01025039.1.p2  ORF type:complete len:118 (+),score=4.70 GHVU01025039.1:1039-1392(+)
MREMKHKEASSTTSQVVTRGFALLFSSPKDSHLLRPDAGPMRPGILSDSQSLGICQQRPSHPQCVVNHHDALRFIAQRRNPLIRLLAHSFVHSIIRSFVLRAFSDHVKVRKLTLPNT